LLAFCGARLVPGIEAVLDVTRFADKLEDADLVLTAEGAIDAQTPHGKALAGIARAARVPERAGRSRRGVRRCRQNCAAMSCRRWALSPRFRLRMRR
jgi:hypothetical protein